MKILVINVCLRGGNARLRVPIGLGYITAAVTNAGYDVEILDIDRLRLSDDQVEAELANRKYDIVLLGCMINGYKKVKKITYLARKFSRSAIIIAGNTVASSIPKHLLDNTEVDIAVMGEGDFTIVELLDCIKAKDNLQKVDGICFKENGVFVETAKRDGVPDLDTLPIVNWDLFNAKSYIAKAKDGVNEPCPIPYEERRVMSLCASRGCAYSCSFCYHAFLGYKYRFRSPEHVLKELILMKEKYDVNYVNFWDEITFLKTDWCDGFLDLLLDADLGIYWNAGCRGDFLNDSNAYLAEKMKKSGCIGLSYSLESANQEILKAMNKRLNLDQISRHKQIMDNAGLASWVSIVIGYPQETEETLHETFDYCEKNRIYPSAGYLLPLPCTRMYEHALANGFIKDEEQYLMDVGDRQDLHVNMSQMTSETMESIVHDRLMQINKKLNLGLSEDSLVKTRSKKSLKI